MSKISQPFVHFDANKMHCLITFFQRTFAESYEKQVENMKISLTKEFEEKIINDILEQYIDYAIAYELVVEDVCPYKILAWYGYLLADALYIEQKELAILAISTSIVCMLRLLRVEQIELEESFHKKALQMVLSELRGNHMKSEETNKKQHTKIGLGMNGLYMMFRTASICKKS
ncbi:hypothetical protein [Campylobacter helveticus]|uniref:hypothetical protein n=1 Tax=Campylobacter helveticus TaxID=28898 RepID=UPI0009C2EE11|nr:hypothetical protein [Campylobacter helveticus]ELU1350313.1 hypothetical protein [Campylobacter jejuni]ARE81461.1 hypothetical protein CHELV3228_a0088 [Campylobacter helveticus]TXK56500.1 hypothetical protein A9726_03055 [Campylobacter helveticus]SMC24802.1 transposase, putative, N-terminal domain-containing protein [Campylobacter helveticus]SUW87696.1 Uncharacterised protein [Campylobacter helveticus]